MYAEDELLLPSRTARANRRSTGMLYSKMLAGACLQPVGDASISSVGRLRLLVSRIGSGLRTRGDITELQGPVVWGHGLQGGGTARGRWSNLRVHFVVPSGYN